MRLSLQTWVALITFTWMYRFVGFVVNQISNWSVNTPGNAVAKTELQRWRDWKETGRRKLVSISDRYIWCCLSSSRCPVTQLKRLTQPDILHTNKQAKQTRLQSGKMAQLIWHTWSMWWKYSPFNMLYSR